MRAITAAMDAIRTMALTIGAEDHLDDPGVRLELSRRLREEANGLSRQASIFEALAVGLEIDSHAQVDAARTVQITEQEGED